MCCWVVGSFILHFYLLISAFCCISRKGAYFVSFWNALRNKTLFAEYFNIWQYLKTDAFMSILKGCSTSNDWMNVGIKEWRKNDWVREWIQWWIYFFPRGYGNESCNLIGSWRGPDLPISGHDHDNGGKQRGWNCHVLLAFVNELAVIVNLFPFNTFMGD